MIERHRGQHGEDCFGCKVKTVQLDPRATPSRRNTVPPKVNTSANAWNRGIVKDDRGVPLIGPKGHVTVKEYADNRGKYEEARRKLANEASANTTR